MSLSIFNAPAGSSALAGYLYALTNKYTFEHDLVDNVFTIGFSSNFTPPSACDDTVCIFVKRVTNGPAAMSAVRERMLLKRGANPEETFNIKELGIHELLIILHCSSDWGVNQKKIFVSLWLTKNYRHPPTASELWRAPQLAQTVRSPSWAKLACLQ